MSVRHWNEIMKGTWKININCIHPEIHKHKTLKNNQTSYNLKNNLINNQTLNLTDNQKNNLEINKINNLKDDQIDIEDIEQYVNKIGKVYKIRFKIKHLKAH